MNWIEVRAELPVGASDSSVWVAIYEEYGIENTLEDSGSLVGCLVDVPGSEERVSALSQALVGAGATVSTREFPEENWEESWRQFFHPRRVGKRIVVVPTWETFPSEPNDIILNLDPGQAFGTGDHPTTRMCLELLEEAEVAGRSVADIGCGSGILAVAAHKLGARSVLATDIDGIAVEVCRENMARNEVSFAAEVRSGVDEIEGTFDLVVSNIISATLIRLAAEVAGKVNEGGHWIVSGIITANWPDVRTAAERVGFRLLNERHEDGWVGATFER